MNDVEDRRFISIDAGPLAYLEAGPSDGPPIVLLHGWPESADSWRRVLELAAADGRHALAFDLPGIGGSVDVEGGGGPFEDAELIHAGIEALGLIDVTLVGQDAGGMTAFSYARRHPLARAVLANTAFPGVEPWDEVTANPYVWHFAFHSIPGLPELLVAGHEREYFDFFFEAIAASPTSVPREARDLAARAYADPRSLTAGFDFYRGLRAAATQNAERVEVTTPVLYLRGDAERGDLEVYERGLRASGFLDVSTGIVEAAGHFSPIEAPDALWRAIAG